MSDWNPLDPDAESVHYDLAEWSLDQRAAVAEVFAEAEVPHAWVGDEVVVPSELEDVADALLDRLEQEFAIDGAAFVSRGSAAAIDEANDDEITEYELDEWTDNERSRLSELLVMSGIPFRWEGAILVTLSEFEDTVDELLDAVEAGDVTIVDSPGAGNATVSAANSELSGETLNQMFLAAERLQRDPLDADGLAMLVRVLDDIEDGGAPFGVSMPAWRQAVELADQLAEALAGSDIPDEIGAMEIAQRLFVTLRPHV